MNWAYGESDPALMLWTAAVTRFELDIPAHATVLELGCAETNWLERMAAQDPTLTLTGVDVHPQVHREAPIVVGSAMDGGLFPAATFDWVVLLGALEHFGLGFYGDPVQADGDQVTMRNIGAWLKPGGWCYFDVPCQPVYEENRHFRSYAPCDIQDRLLAGSSLIERQRAYSEPEPKAGVWVDAPTHRRTPYWFVAVVAQNCPEPCGKS